MHAPQLEKSSTYYTKYALFYAISFLITIYLYDSNICYVVMFLVNHEVHMSIVNGK